MPQSNYDHTYMHNRIQLDLMQICTEVKPALNNTRHIGHIVMVNLLYPAMNAMRIKHGKLSQDDSTYPVIASHSYGKWMEMDEHR